ncbi:MAG: hypothetical protein ACYC2K_09525 [Gemmatimonadales bacterium]
MRSWWLILALVSSAATGAVGQTPPPAPPQAVALPPVQPPAADDTLSYLARPIKPLKAFFMSLAVPGWSQARLDRKLTGALFVTIEGLAVGMTVKTIRELKYLERVGADSARIVSKRSQRQDWLILLGFNHLFSGIEAFVGSQLHDFPEDLRLRAVPMPSGGIGFQASVPIRWP